MAKKICICIIVCCGLAALFGCALPTDPASFSFNPPTGENHGLVTDWEWSHDTLFIKPQFQLYPTPLREDIIYVEITKNGELVYHKLLYKINNKFFVVALPFAVQLAQAFGYNK